MEAITVSGGGRELLKRRAKGSAPQPLAPQLKKVRLQPQKTGAAKKNDTVRDLPPALHVAAIMPPGSLHADRIAWVGGVGARLKLITAVLRVPYRL